MLETFSKNFNFFLKNELAVQKFKTKLPVEKFFE